jgi:hypothetical protein
VAAVGDGSALVSGDPVEESSQAAGVGTGRAARTDGGVGQGGARLAGYGYPNYEPHYGGGEIPMQTWRTHLRTLDAGRTEIETHPRGRSARLGDRAGTPRPTARPAVGRGRALPTHHAPW